MGLHGQFQVLDEEGLHLECPFGATQPGGRAVLDAVNVVIGGEAGQGLATIGEVFTRSLVGAGYFVVVTLSYQSRIRGGHNTFAVRANGREIFAPQESIDVLVALDTETFHLHKAALSEHGVVLIDADSGIDAPNCARVPFRELAGGRFSNTVALGALAALIGLPHQALLDRLERLFKGRHKDLTVDDRGALEAGRAWMSDWMGRDYRQNTSPAARCIAPGKMLGPLSPCLEDETPGRPARLTMNGNEAIALGAMSAGVKFCAFYPMTPATSIAVALADKADRMGIIVEQAEDEIAAVNMAIGASFAGAPSIVPTSGGGFALMTEAVSLAGMTETPLVVAIAQRPGPSTGLPSRTEQADLEFVLHSGHGEFPRAIFAPGSPEECFHLTRKAFEISQRYASPVFVLTDQFLADSYRSVGPFDLDNLPPVTCIACSDAPDSPHLPFKITGSGVSPRLLPGFSQGLVVARSTERVVVADSDEHTEDGHITEDASVRKAMVEKRLRKLDGIRAEVLPPTYIGEDAPDLLLVCWGSTMGAVLESSMTLRSEGWKVGMLHFSQVWPVVGEQFVPGLEAAREVVCVESNATGQMARLIRRETGFRIPKLVLRYDGQPMTPEYILRDLRENG